MESQQKREVFGFSQVLYELMHGGVTYDQTGIKPDKAHLLLAELKTSGASAETVKIVARLLRFHRENLVANGVVSPEVPVAFRNHNETRKELG